MKNLFFTITLISGIVCTASAQENVSNDFWDYDTSYVQPVTSSQSSVTVAEVSGFTCKSVWDDMATTFSTFVRGLSFRIW